MNPIVLVLLLTLTFSSVEAEPWWSIFQKPTPKIVKKSKKHVGTKPVRVNKPNVPQNYRVVDTQWWADYLALEAQWDYYIPEDDYVWSANGKYLVPIVVYRHYEDMSNASVKR